MCAGARVSNAAAGVRPRAGRRGGVEPAQALGERGEVVRQPVEQLLLAQQRFVELLQGVFLKCNPGFKLDHARGQVARRVSAHRVRTPDSATAISRSSPGPCLSGARSPRLGRAQVFRPQSTATPGARSKTR